MFKVLISMDCDSCHRPFRFSFNVTPRLMDWNLFSGSLVCMALDDHWTARQDSDVHLCDSCSREMEHMALLSS